jgi:hypothetical protein
MKNKIEDLRNHLFETLEALKDTDKPMELERASAIANVARVIVDTAKVEVEFAKVTSDATGEFRGCSFLPAPQGATAPTELVAVSGRRVR